MDEIRDVPKEGSPLSLLWRGQQRDCAIALFLSSWFNIFRRGKQPPFGDNEPLQSAGDSCTGKDKTQSDGMSHHLVIEYF